MLDSQLNVEIGVHQRVRRCLKYAAFISNSAKSGSSHTTGYGIIRELEKDEFFQDVLKGDSSDHFYRRCQVRGDKIKTQEQAARQGNGQYSHAFYKG